eukprot:761787-Hanusia_phi.AAC.1
MHHRGAVDTGCAGVGELLAGPLGGGRRRGGVGQGRGKPGDVGRPGGKERREGGEGRGDEASPADGRRRGRRRDLHEHHEHQEPVSRPHKDRGGDGRREGEDRQEEAETLRLGDRYDPASKTSLSGGYRDLCVCVEVRERGGERPGGGEG